MTKDHKRTETKPEKEPTARRGEAPDGARLTEHQAIRLSRLTGIPSDELRTGTIAELRERLKWRIDPTLLLFRPVTGRVVKRDLATGVDYPVPFATVHVEDTDSSFLGVFPSGSAFSWFLPVATTREVVGATTTDDCGRFTAWIPRFEIDYVLHWRLDRFCYADVFERPTIREVIDGLEPNPGRAPPIPGPGPGPFARSHHEEAPLQRAATGRSPLLIGPHNLSYARVEAAIGRDAATRLGAIEAAAAFGASARGLEDFLSERAFPDGLAAPLPPRLAEAIEEGGAKAIAAYARLDPVRFDRFDASRIIGPFRRCVDLFVPEVAPILDVPDVTFRVTQDVDGDGDEEVVYAEGYFDVRWNAGSAALTNVLLRASPTALHSVACDVPEMPCVEPAISSLGLMPLINPPLPADPYHDPATGYARRPNRPHPSGAMSEAPPLSRATAPFGGTLQIYGCNEKAGAQYYRIVSAFEGGPSLPMTNTWKVFRLVGAPPHLEVHDVVPDSAGWYPILDPADGWNPANLLMNWPTGAAGSYRIGIELGNGSKAVIDSTGPIGVRVDNTSPAATFTGLAWRVAGASTWKHFASLVCPVVRRPHGADVDLRVGYQAAATHLLYARLAGAGCGGGAPTLKSAPSWSDPPSGTHPAERWHANPLDNHVARTAVFDLAGSAPPGAYGFDLTVASRVFNPAGGDGGFEADWNYTSVVRWTPAHLPIAIVDE